jgi:hypothetical protein
VKPVWKTLFATLLVVLVFALSLLTSMPAAFLVGQVEARVPPDQRPLSLKMARGTIWDGKGLLTGAGIRGELAWTIRPSGLLHGVLPMHLKFTDPDVNLQALVTAGVTGKVWIEGDGQVGLKVLRPVLQRHGIDIPGQVMVRRVAASVDIGKRWLTEADGLLESEGGDVSFPMGSEKKTARVPPLKGMLAMENSTLLLSINMASTGNNLLEIRLDKDQMARVSVRKRLLDELNLPWGQQSAEDAIIFKVQQRLGL